MGMGEFLLRLAGKADDDVEADGRIRQARANSLDQCAKEGCVAATPHASQDRIIAGLQGDMQMRAEDGGGGEKIKESVGDFRRFDGAETQAFDPRFGQQSLQQGGQVRGRGEVAAVTANVDAGEDNFGIAGSDKVAHLLQHLLGRHRAAAAAGVGDDAVGTEGVAAVLDLDEGTAALGEAPQGGDLGRGGVTDGGDPHRAVPLFRQQAQQIALLLVAENQGDAGDGGKGLGVDLGIAAGDDDAASGMETAGAADEIARLAVGGGGDGAGVDDDQLGPGLERDDGPAGRGQAFFKGGRFELVGLAAEGGDSGGTGHGRDHDDVGAHCRPGRTQSAPTEIVFIRSTRPPGPCPPHKRPPPVRE